MTKLKTIAVLTTIRSEYGLLKPLLEKIKSEHDFRLQLLIGGGHLNHSFGYTKSDIVADGFEIEEEFDFLTDDQSIDYLTKAMSKLNEQIGFWFASNKPDLFLVLGDRFELIPAVTSALIYNIPIAHISGGDVTEGAIDNQIRNAITKMAHLHFPATEIYKQNILKMGEEEWRICVSGEPGLDEILNINFYTKSELFHELKLDVNKPVICTTFHPETIENTINPEQLEDMFTQILNSTDYQVLATASNFDKGGIAINKKWEELAEKYTGFVYVKSLGQKRYYSLLKHAAFMLGNSSSGLVEAQSFNLPVINVGNRQAGRLANSNVYNVDAITDDVLKAINVVTSQSFFDSFKNQSNIYGDGHSCNKIVNYIKQVSFQKLLVKKSTF